MAREKALDHETRETSKSRESKPRAFRVSRLSRHFESFAIQTPSSFPAERLGNAVHPSA
jgi:hypothetical protein